MSGTVVVGLDVGGTSTRAAALRLDGVRLGSGRAGGGNPTSHGAERAAHELLTALRGALAEVDPTRVRAGAIGLAGAGRLLADPAGRAAFDRAWHDAGLRCPYAVHGDALVAYASGTAVPDGTVLIAGTGAIAAQVRDLRLDRTADGHGWLLGDAGSGFWLGREAVRRLLTDLDRARPPGGLAARVLAELTGSPDVAAPPRATAEAVVQAVTRRPPVELARLAPLVVAAAVEGDPTGVELVGEAAALLAESVTRIRPAGATDPVVLGGGLLTADTPLAAAARAELARRWPDAPLRTAGDGAAAAAWLAARELPEVTDPPALHAVLVPTST
ncbi:BadF/BadG/BcrA/BcrD ATPase family protein [Micromonospora coerulea]|uniref:BadF/BadG/BcrA/BcrD ATPase family protein n=1 Tax=Micromonospora coerulea TaxID=47856 RepID=A0ABP8SSP9_9ACTN